MEATWIGFNLWKEAVALEGTVDVREVRRTLAGPASRRRAASKW